MPPRWSRLGAHAFGWLAPAILAWAAVLEGAHVDRPNTHERHTDESTAVRVQVHVQDSSGEPLFARVVATPDAAWVGGKHAIAHADRGASLSLPVGRYTITATRGPEWSTATQHLEVHEGEAPSLALALVLEHEVDSSGYVGCDFHLHAEASPDSEVALDARVASLAAEGLGFAVPTDHNQVTSYAASIAQLGAPVGTLSGVEITTWAPEIGHFNAFPVERAPRALGREPQELLAELHRDPRVVVQVNHPRLQDHIAYFDMAGLDADGAVRDPRFSLELDAVEVWNGYDLARPAHRDRVLADWLALLARGHRLVATGSSDSHDLDAQRPGYPRTYVQLEQAQAQAEPSEVAAALKAGRAFVTSGPLLFAAIEGREPGDTVELDASGHAWLDVRVQAPAWMRVDTLQVYAGRAIVLTRALPQSTGAPLDVRVRLAVELGAAPFVVVTVSGSESMDALHLRRGARPFAFTNPIWLRAPSAPKADAQNAARNNRATASRPTKQYKSALDNES